MATFLEAFQLYQKNLVNKKRKPETIRGVSLCLSYFVELYGNMDTTDVTLSEMKLFFEMLQKRRKKKRNANGEYTIVGAAFVHKVMKQLKAFIRWINEKNGIKNFSPGDVPNISHVPKHPKYLTDVEMNLLFTQLETDIKVAKQNKNISDIYTRLLHRAVFWMMYTTGLRNFELRELKWQDLDLDNLVGYIVGKGNKPASITYNDTTKQYLLEYLQYRNKLFPNNQYSIIFTALQDKKGRGLSAYGLNIILKKLAKRAGITRNMHAHLLRHTLATYLINQGWHIIHVKEKMRHSDIGTTSIYSHSNNVTQMNMTNSLGQNLPLS